MKFTDFGDGSNYTESSNEEDNDNEKITSTIENEKSQYFFESEKGKYKAKCSYYQAQQSKLFQQSDKFL
jgi:hypothetical protein